MSVNSNNSTEPAPYYDIPLNGSTPNNMTEEEIEVGTRRLAGIPQASKYGFIFTVFSMVMYIVDSGVDVYVAVAYYTKEYYTYFGLTLAFVLVPAVVTTAFSIILYALDSKDSEIPQPTREQKAVRWFFSLLQLGPVLRDVNVLNYGIRSALALERGDLPAQKEYFKAMQLEESDAAFLRLFERFLEAAPQLTLQVFVIIHHIHDSDADFDGFLQRLSIFTSLVSLAWSLTSYNNSSRTTVPDKENLTYWGKLFQFLWNLCMIFSRVCALAFFASAHPMFIGPFCALHWIVMLVWLIGQESLRRRQERSENDPGDQDGVGNCNNNSCLNSLRSFGMNAVFAFVHLFVFLNVADEPTRHKYGIFYAVILFENTVIIFTSMDSATHPEVYWTIFISYGLFFLGFVFMFIYFKWFHPSLKFSTVDGALRHMISLGPVRDRDRSASDEVPVQTNGSSRCNGNLERCSPHSESAQESTMM